MIAEVTQLPFCFTAESRIVPAPSTGTIDERFEAFARSNPAIVNLFEELALQSVRRGRRRVGAKAIVEVIRWSYDLVSDDPDGFKINNVFTSRLARIVAERNPELRGVFETRVLKSRAA